jgi:hypothetical protein
MSLFHPVSHGSDGKSIRRFFLQAVMASAKNAFHMPLLERR